ncbi:MAG: NADH-quinone oxidoreductase subunit NuoG [Ktedonobacterales bacterium]|nr:NADH-quinone oxidoreductase subunit NuoG [Ktedonobacterales bacterium]
MSQEEAVPQVTLTIDGREVSVPKGTVVWKAAQAAGIEVPIYCYHPKMPPLGACRMCFVEIEPMTPPIAKAPQTACTTEVRDGMVVHTDTPLVKKSRKGTLEFLLINHPLDCPICDKGGECDLQDFTLRHGPGASRFDLTKRHFQKPIPVSDNILLDRERCIACQRCVRFTQEVAQEPGLILLERGFRTEVGVDPGAPFDSIFSGNVVEMCPVGALTAKSYRFMSRPWELKRTPSVCPGCSVGCNVRVDVRVDRIMRLMSRPNDDIDDGWLCDKGRWGYESVNDPQRLRVPLVRKNGELTEVTWDEALDTVATRLREIMQKHGSAAIGGIGSTHTTNEENFLFQKALREGLGTNNIDHYHGVFPAASQGAMPWVFTGSIAGIDNASDVVLIGANPYTRQPVLDLRIKKALRNGARLTVISAETHRIERLATRVVRIKPGTEAAIAKTLAGVVVGEKLTRGVDAHMLTDDYQARFKSFTPERMAEALGTDAEALRALAREVAGAKGAVILYDEAATRLSGNESLAADVFELGLLTDNVTRQHAGVGPLWEDANSLGARDMGVLPDVGPGYQPLAKPGRDYDAMLRGGVKALWVMGADPARHMERPAALAEMDFLVVQEMALTETAKQADVVLPALSYAEKIGSFTNLERRVQVLRRALVPLPGAKADWEILRGVATRLGLAWSYRSPSDVLTEIATSVPYYAGLTREALGDTGARWSFADERATVTAQA